MVRILLADQQLLSQLHLRLPRHERRTPSFDDSQEVGTVRTSSPRTRQPRHPDRPLGLDVSLRTDHPGRNSTLTIVSALVRPLLRARGRSDRRHVLQVAVFRRLHRFRRSGCRRQRSRQMRFDLGQLPIESTRQRQQQHLHHFKAESVQETRTESDADSRIDLCNSNHHFRFSDFLVCKTNLQTFLHPTDGINISLHSCTIGYNCEKQKNENNFQRNIYLPSF